jgi:hypothetical protein
MENLRKAIEQVEGALGLVTAVQHIDELERGQIEELLQDALEMLKGHSTQLLQGGWKKQA